MKPNYMMWYIITKEQAVALWLTDSIEIYKLYDDDSEGLCESLEDIINSESELGIEVTNYKIVPCENE